MPQGNLGSGPLKSLNMELIVLSDFRILQDVIKQMMFDTVAGRSQALTSQPVRRQVIISELEKILGMEALKWGLNLNSGIRNAYLNRIKIMTNFTCLDFPDFDLVYQRVGWANVDFIQHG